MHEVIPGIFHWTAEHGSSGSRVSSYYVAEAAALIDPKVPEGGPESLPGRPEQVVLTSGHHLRDAEIFARAFAIPIRASRQAALHIGDPSPITVVEDGAEAAPGIRVLHIGVMAQDEGALHIAHGGGALAIADAVTNRDGQLGFFPDSLLGDDPEAVKLGLKGKLSQLAAGHAFEALLFAHSEPITANGRIVLADFAAG